jgi:hypothetical protein
LSRKSSSVPPSPPHPKLCEFPRSRKGGDGETRERRLGLGATAETLDRRALHIGGRGEAKACYGYTSRLTRGAWFSLGFDRYGFRSASLSAHLKGL